MVQMFTNRLYTHLSLTKSRYMSLHKNNINGQEYNKMYFIAPTVTCFVYMNKKGRTENDSHRLQ